MKRTPEQIQLMRKRILHYVSKREGCTVKMIASGLRATVPEISRDLEVLHTHQGKLRRTDDNRYYLAAPQGCALADLYAPKIDPKKDKYPSRIVRFSDDWRPNKDRPLHRIAISSGMGFDAVSYGALGYGD